MKNRRVPVSSGEKKPPRYALFIGCTIPARLPAYEASARAVLGALGIEVADMDGFNCCGYPLRNYDENSFVYAAARNLALAENAGLDILALCMCCFGSLKKAVHYLGREWCFRDRALKYLDAEGLSYGGRVRVKHLLSVLYHDLGTEQLSAAVKRPVTGLNVGAHYGCHALRPSGITGFDDPDRPALFDSLVEACGAVSVQWQMKTDCCGAPLMGSNDSLSSDIMEKKIMSASLAGAEVICTSCPYCQLRFERREKGGEALPSLLYTQLLGLALGIDAEELSINKDDMNFMLEKINLQGPS